MTQRLQRSRTFPINDSIDITLEYGKEKLCGSKVFTVLVVTAKHRRAWTRAITRLGIKADEVPGTACDHKPGCGYSPRTIAYTCCGTAADLEELGKLYVVEDVTV